MTYGTILYSVSFFPFSQANKAYRTPPGGKRRKIVHQSSADIEGNDDC